MKITVIPAGQLHAGQMADLLNEIIGIGGTTALTTKVTKDQMAGWMTSYPGRSAWHVAEDENGTILGFQWIEPGPDLPPEAAEIATFAKVGATGLGIGSALFNATEVSARRLGFHWIRANIRADNTGGLAYYQSRGFEDYGRINDYRLDDGTTVDKVLKRYSL